VPAALVLLAAGVAFPDQAVYRMTGATLPVERVVNGYRLEVHDDDDGVVEVRVTTSLGPIGSNGTYTGVGAGRRPQVPEAFDLPSGLRTRLRLEVDAWQAATAVLEWVTDHIQLIAHDNLPQDAASVLARGGGRCSGLANATAALLMAAGFEARTVSGLLIGPREAIPHRWVECRLPGAGWVPTDPTLGWWVITAGHVAFSDTVDEVPEIVVVEPTTSDLRRFPRLGTTIVRPNHGAELICRLDDTDETRRVVARLERGSDRHRAVLGSEVRFSRLLPGRWLLTVELDGRVVERRRLTLRSGSVHSYVVRLPGEEPEEVGS
jgi:hypothetical protein